MSRQNALDNRSNQLNPNHNAYWQSRGFDERPEDWKERNSKDELKQQADDAVTKQPR